MIGMFHWAYQTPNKRVHDDRAENTIIDVEAARHPNQPHLEEARRRWMDQRTLHRPDDID